MENSILATNNLNEPLRSDDKSPVSLNSNVKWNDNIEHELIEEDIIPYVGMQFDTEDHAYRFYHVYAGFAGFSIRRDWRNKSKLDNKTVMSRKFVCFKEGFKRTKDDDDEKVSRKDIRTGCLAHVVIGRELSGKYVVTSFVKDHNHELASPRSKHKLPSQRRVSAAQAAEVEIANRSGIRQKLIFELMSQHVGYKKEGWYITVERHA